MVRRNWKRLGVLLILFACIIFSIIWCNVSIAKNHETDLVNNLRVHTQQGVKTIETELHADQIHMYSMAAEFGPALERGDSAEEIIGRLGSVNQIASFKRIGYAGEDGIAITTDGYRKEIGFREFFQRSMNGELVITNTLMDTIGEEEPINVFSTPVYRSDGTVCGVLFAACRNEEFQRLFDIESYDTTGSSCIVNEKSEVLIATSSLPFDPGEYTLWSFIESFGPKAKTIMSDYYKNGEEKGKIYYNVNIDDETNFFICYEPIEMGEIAESWYLVTLVSKNALAREVTATMRSISTMLVQIGLLVVLAFLLFAIDMGKEERRQREELEKVAYVDVLTGGDNYASFKRKTARQDKIGYLVSMDIHAFKMVNSVCGNERGDEIIRQIHGWICECLDEGDLAAHVNADRFVLFFPGLDRDAVIRKLTQINEKILQETKRADIPQISAYFGVAWYDKQFSVEKAFSDANFARDSIHEKRGVFYSFFDKYATEHLLEEKLIEDSFEGAVAKREFEVWYQPKYSPDTRRIVGAEALVRWRKEDGTLVSPGKFIPIYENNGMIRQLDEYVFREVCAEQRKLMDMGRELFPVSVNLSRASLYSLNIVKHYLQITTDIGIDPKVVPIEITESAAVDDDIIKSLMEEFYKAGFPLHMDDFGSGYSSLASLNQMHFDTLKLDKSLIDYIGNFGGDQLIKHTIALAKELGMHVTAEGVEEERQVEFLQKQNCDSIQGFYYSKPIPQSDFESLIGLGDA